MHYISKTCWIHLKNVLKTPWRHVNENSSTWWYIWKTSWKGLEDVFKTSLQDVFKTFWRRLEDVFKTFLQDVLKKFWKCLQDVWPRWICSEVLKTSSDDVWLGKANLSWWKYNEILNYFSDTLTRKSSEVWSRQIFL